MGRFSGTRGNTCPFQKGLSIQLDTPDSNFRGPYLPLDNSSNIQRLSCSKRWSPSPLALHIHHHISGCLAKLYVHYSRPISTGYGSHRKHRLSRCHFQNHFYIDRTRALVQIILIVTKLLVYYHTCASRLPFVISVSSKDFELFTTRVPRDKRRLFTTISQIVSDENLEKASLAQATRIKVPLRANKSPGFSCFPVMYSALENFEYAYIQRCISI